MKNKEFYKALSLLADVGEISHRIEASLEVSEDDKFEWLSVLGQVYETLAILLKDSIKDEEEIPPVGLGASEWDLNSIPF